MRGKVTNPAGEVLPGGWAHPPVAVGALTWQASLGLLFLGDPSPAEVLAALTWPWGEGWPWGGCSSQIRVW